MKRNDLTSSERAAYQAMIARGYAEEDAYEAALDGVTAKAVREAKCLHNWVYREGVRICHGCNTVRKSAY